MPTSKGFIRYNFAVYVRGAKKVGECLQFWRKWPGGARCIYEGHHGKILPPEIKVCHTCDNGEWCINVDHMWEGTQAENMQDCRDKGRLYFQTRRRASKGSSNDH